MNVRCIRDSVLSVFRRSLFVVNFCVASLLLPLAAHAVDCIPDDIFLGSQADVDTFQVDYNSCTNVVGTLWLNEGTFTSLDGLQDIIGIGGNLDIEISKVSSLSGLSNLVSIGGSLQIQSQLSGSFSSFAGLSSLTSLGRLMIEDSNTITSLSGMTMLTSLGGIHLFNVRALTNLTGLPAGLDMITDISISSNDSLQSLDGLSPVNGVLDLVVEDNPNLTSISALAGSVFSDTYDHPFDEGIPNLSISNNPNLSSLNGVPSVLPPGTFQTLIIQDTPLITSLSVLDGVVEVWFDFGLFENIALSDCSSLTKLLDEFDDSFRGPNDFSSDPFAFPPDVTNSFYEPTLQGNAAGCRSIAEILGRGSEDGVFMDSFETK